MLAAAAPRPRRDAPSCPAVLTVRGGGWRCVAGADGLGMQSLGGDMLTGSQAAPGSVKAQAIQFISASQYLRVPLIFLNIIVILVKLIFG